MVTRCKHQPVPDSCRSPMGRPVDLAKGGPADYPVDGVCMNCGIPITCAEFRAISPDSDWVPRRALTAYRA